MIMTLVKLQREKYFIATKEINLKKQEIAAKGIKKVLFALVSSGKVDKLLHKEENVIYGSIPDKE